MNSFPDPYRELEIYLEKAQEDIGKAFEELQRSEEKCQQVNPSLNIVSSVEVVLPPPAFRSSLDNNENYYIPSNCNANKNATEWWNYYSVSSYSHPNNPVSAFKTDATSGTISLPDETDPHDSPVAFSYDKRKLRPSISLPLGSQVVDRQEVTLPKNFKYGRKRESNLLDKAHCFGVEMQRIRNNGTSLDNSKCCFVEENSIRSVSPRCSTHSLPASLDVNLLSLWADNLVNEIDNSLINELNAQVTSKSMDLSLLENENVSLSNHVSLKDKEYDGTSEETLSHASYTMSDNSTCENVVMAIQGKQLPTQTNGYCSKTYMCKQNNIDEVDSMPSKFCNNQLAQCHLTGIVNFIAPPPPPEFDDSPYFNMERPNNRGMNGSAFSYKFEKRSVNTQVDIDLLKLVNTTTSVLSDKSFDDIDVKQYNFSKDSKNLHSVHRTKKQIYGNCRSRKNSCSNASGNTEEILASSNFKSDVCVGHKSHLESCPLNNNSTGQINFKNIFWLSNVEKTKQSFKDPSSRNSKTKQARGTCSIDNESLQAIYRRCFSFPDVSHMGRKKNDDIVATRKTNSLPSRRVRNQQLSTVISQDAVTQTTPIVALSRSSSFTWISECDCSEWESVNVRSTFEDSTRVFPSFNTSDENQSPKITRNSSSLSSSTDEGNGFDGSQISDCSSLYLSAYSDAADSPSGDSSFEDINDEADSKPASGRSENPTKSKNSVVISTLNSTNFYTSKGTGSLLDSRIVVFNGEAKTPDSAMDLKKTGKHSNADTEVSSMDSFSILTPIAKSKSCGNATYCNQLLELNKLNSISTELPVKSMSVPLLRQRKKHTTDKIKRKRCLLPEDSMVDLDSLRSEFEFSEKALSLKELRELQAIESCRWLRAAGFPQYAQMYDDDLFPIDISTAQRDHAFLHPDSIQSLFRRLNTLNRCARMKFVDNLPFTSLNLDDSDEEEECALSENWEFQRVSRRWSRIPSPNHESKEPYGRARSPSPKPTKKTLSFKRFDDAYYSSRDSMFSEEQQSSPASIRRYGLRNDERFLPVISLRDGGTSPGSSSESGGASLVSEERLDGTNLRRSSSDRIKERAKALLRRMESLKVRKKKKGSTELKDSSSKPHSAGDGISSCSSSLNSSPLLSIHSRFLDVGNPLDDSLSYNENFRLTVNNKEIENSSHSDSECQTFLVPERRKERSIISSHTFFKSFSQSLKKEKNTKPNDKESKKSSSLRTGEKLSPKMSLLSPTRSSLTPKKKQLHPKNVYLSPDHIPHYSQYRDLSEQDAHCSYRDTEPENPPAPLVVFNNAYVDSLERDLNEPGSSRGSLDYLSLQMLGDNDEDIIVISNKPKSPKEVAECSRDSSPILHPWHCFSSQTSRMNSDAKAIPIASLSCSQILVFRKLALLKLTTLMEKHSPSSRTGWSWAVPNFIKRIRAPDYKDKVIFGVPLAVLLQRNGQHLPGAIQSAFTYLRNTALKSVGLFRKSGVRSRIQKLRNMTESKSGTINFDGQQPFDVADLIKQYFRDLPEALLTGKLSETFVAVYQYIPDDQKIEAIQAAILLMPDENREVLQVLLAFLLEVTEHADENQMTATNLAVCFAPSLFQLSSPRNSSVSPLRRKTVGAPDIRELNENKAAYECLASMIENYEDLYSIPTHVISESELSCLNTCEPATLDQVSNLVCSDSVGWKLYIDDCIQVLLKEVKDKYKGWTNVSQSENIDLSYKKPDDGHPLRLWKVSTEVEAPPTELLNSIIRERHLWDLSFVKSKVVKSLEKQTEVFQFLINCAPPHPPCDYCIIRSWRTDLLKGACVLVEASIDHPEAVRPADSVRALILASRYFIEPCGSGKSRITHISRVDTKGRSTDWHNRAYGHLCSLNIMKLRDSFSHIRTEGPETKV